MKAQDTTIKQKSQVVVERLIEAIEEGDYGAGDKLPPERELAKQFNVSRPSLREAISALEIAGVIESKRGSGTYIKSLNKEFEKVQSKAFNTLHTSADPVTVYEARRVIEGGLGFAVINNATQEDIEELNKAINKICETIEKKDFQEYIEGERLFHLNLVKASHNNLLESFIHPLVNVMNEDLWQDMLKKQLFFSQYYVGGQNECEMHTRIVQAIKDRSIEDYHNAIEYHFDSFDFSS